MLFCANIKAFTLDSIRYDKKNISSVAFVVVSGI